MLDLHRARQLLLVALLGSIVLVAIEFPFRQLMSQRVQISKTALALQAVENHNTILQHDILSLSKTSTIISIAHQEYGLVQPGQRSYVILPNANAKQNMNPLTALVIPAEVLGSTSTSGSTMVVSASHVASRTVGSLWSRMLRRLEFWH
ncbi:MAG TPA: hypothetical protein VNE42_05735 [Acidimicrobiales bacterium]|nr:hypothetical protein [Acidimicrobiales bacterium]